ncbi:PEP-CTERM-box response regulator transcription factor [Haloferula sp.]|uniref:PEP-CTERM-box response regulator transcription factor n=1 Tax=Haloferula sp. TaxID=2497595 RepID=UPI003C707D83
MKPKVLVIDDDEEIRTQMRWAISGDYEVSLAADRESAINSFRKHSPDVVILDLGLPPSPSNMVEGMLTLSSLMSLDRTVKFIVVSGQSDRENAVRAIGAGAYDFLCKPVDLEQLKLLLQRCMFVSGLEREYLKLESSERPDMFEGLLGRSEPMQEVFRTIMKVAKSSAPILILGESGTGKEMVANAIHRSGGTPDAPFVAINCNAIPESLIESELFGYEKGAFTGADSQRIGLIEAAAGGTLFLDEIGDLPGPVQVKLLRFLQEKKIQRVGGRKEIAVDTRVLAATHVDLTKAIEDGRFREDLYFRLAVVVCKIPPLRERGGDVLLLANDFLRCFAARDGRAGLHFDQKAEREIVAHPWPGNVRELQNRVQRAVIMAEGKRIDVADLELEIPLGETLREARERLEVELVRKALDRNGNKIAAAARELGVSRPTFYELMNKLGISRG